MGRGKKKDKGQKPAASKDEETVQGIEDLSIRPSTSGSVEETGSGEGRTKDSVSSEKQVPEASKATGDGNEDDEDLGLGLGGGKKRIRKKKAAPATAEIKSESEPVASTSSSAIETKPEPKPEVKAAEEEDGGGLGLGLGTGKSRPRKKKGLKTVAAPEIAPAAVSVPSQPQAAAPAAMSAPTQPLAPAPTQAPAGAWPPVAGPATTAPTHWCPPTAPKSRTLPPPAGGGFPQEIRPSPPPSVPQARGAIPRQEQISKYQAPPSTMSMVPAQPTSDYRIPAKIVNRTSRVQMVPTEVLANYLPMQIRPMIIHRYDVAVTPDKPKKLSSLAVRELINKEYAKYPVAYDQMKLAFSPNQLPGVSSTAKHHVVHIQDPNGKTMKFEVSFKCTGTVDLGIIKNYMQSGTSLHPPAEAIHAVDVVLRQGALERYVKAGRTFFKRPANPTDLGDGLEMWTGLFQSAIFTSRPFLNIDVAHKGFPKQQPLLQVIELFGFNSRSPLETQRGNIDRLRDFLKGLRVVALIGGDQSTPIRREYICNDLCEPPSKKKFMITDDKGKEREITVAEYFVKEKGCRLRYPDVNCVWVGPTNRTIYYPMELLEVSFGQVLNRQLTERQLSVMVRQAAAPPAERKQKIEAVIRDMNYSKNLFFKKFGLEITEEFTKVQAKIINPPMIKYKNGAERPRNGSWRSRQMFQGMNLRKWGIISVECYANCDEVIKFFKDCSNDMGMMIAEPEPPRVNVPRNQVERIMQEAAQNKLQLLFVVVSARAPKDLYANVKKSAECRVGLLTQCLKDQTLQRMNKQTATNILLKVNSKLMGVNQAIEPGSLPQCLRGGGVMVVGADVTHPSPEQLNVPSIAAVTASIDVDCFQYNIGLSIQTPKKEMIVEFQDMMVEHLMAYRQKQRDLPRKIYVFRDGVSEGQFGQVMQQELRAIYYAYARLSGTTKKPEVLFLLVQKRHHTRLFTLGNQPMNVQPGTVVDTDIVHARELDFYLVSHQAIKGTARPTRYHAVCNDGNLPSDEVEQLAYYLCHLYSRCSRSVSYPTPTYYAHLACLRARVLTSGERFDNRELEKNPRRLRVLDRMLDCSTMFFV